LPRFRASPISPFFPHSLCWWQHYGRCVILFGIPYQYTKSHVLRARLDYMREKYLIRDNDFLTFDALRQAAQCVGRVIRSKRDYGAVVLADSRYQRQDKRSKLPPWVIQFLKENQLNLSVDVAVAQIKTFLKEMGQPEDHAAFMAMVLDEGQVTALNRSRTGGFQSAYVSAAAGAAAGAAMGTGAGTGASAGGQAEVVEEEDDDGVQEVLLTRRAATSSSSSSSSSAGAMSEEAAEAAAASGAAATITSATIGAKRAREEEA